MGRPKLNRKAKCHSQLPHYGKSMCRSCYRKSVYPKYRDENRKKCLEWYKKHPRLAKRQVEHTLDRRTGLQIGTYKLVYTKQKGKCLICKTKYKRLHRDHNHLTGKFRGLLCMNCNLGLGQFKDNLKTLKKAIHYLEEY